jgi:hypothetical protein
VTARTARLLRAAGALAVLIAVIVGVPLLLAALHLLPHSLPSVGEVIARLRVRDDGQLVQVLLAAGAWVCWALFTISTVPNLSRSCVPGPLRRCRGCESSSGRRRRWSPRSPWA